MTLIEELKYRGFLHQCTDEESLNKKLKSENSLLKFEYSAEISLFNFLSSYFFIDSLKINFRKESFFILTHSSLLKFEGNRKG